MLDNGMKLDFLQQVVFALDSPLYVTDTDGIIVYVNPAFEEVTGYMKQELLGQKTSIIKSGKMPNSYYEKLWSTLLDGKTWKEEIINRRKDGSEYVALQYVTPVADAQGRNKLYAAVQYDITREKELQDEREIFFDVSVDLFCIIEPDGRLRQTNGAWKDILGWKQDDLAGKPIIGFIHEDDRENFTAVNKQICRSGEIAPLDVRVQAANGSFRWVSWRIYFHGGKELFYASGRDIQKRVEMEEEIRKISVTDALTGLYNRLKFNEDLERELARAKRYGTPCSLILFDIDHFKSINDTYGHGTGDEVLKRLAAVVGGLLRETDIFCRWGGEEFVIVCPNTGSDDVFALAERVRVAVEEYQFGKVEKVTISLGVSAYLPESDNEETLVKRADTALYEAKNLGRNRTVHGS